MLIQFNFKNYKSFRDETSLDLSATKMKEFESSVVTIGGEKILPVAAVYGANASGKSNVYSAFEFMTAYVKNRFFMEMMIRLLQMPDQPHFCLIAVQGMPSLCLKCILPFRGRVQRKHTITDFALTKRA